MGGKSVWARIPNEIGTLGNRKEQFKSARQQRRAVRIC
jgi:hypothetical protein